MPPTNADGKKTATSTSAIAITGLVNSRIAFSVASGGERPSSMCFSTASTTTIASSTTMPIASTKPNSVRVLMLNASGTNTAKVPISDTGTASIGISDVLTLPKNTNTTNTTSTIASISVRITSMIESVTKIVLSYDTA